MEMRKHDSTMNRRMRDLKEGAAAIITLLDLLYYKLCTKDEEVCEQ